MLKQNSYKLICIYIQNKEMLLTTMTYFLFTHPLPLSRAPHVKFQPTHVADQADLGQRHGNHREEVAPRHHGLHECLVGRVDDVTFGFFRRFNYFPRILKKKLTYEKKLIVFSTKLIYGCYF